MCSRYKGERMRILIPVLIATMLGACAVKELAPVKETATEALPQATAIPETFNRPVDVEQIGEAVAGDARNGWLASFGDPGLEAIVAEAIRNNLNLRAAVAKLDAAAGLAIQAGAELTPAVTAGGQTSSREGFSTNAPELTSTGASLNISWELDIWGRVRSQAAAGAAFLQATEAQVKWAYESIAAQTAKSWFLLTEARLQENLAEEAVTIFTDTVTLVEAKFTQGQGTSRDVALAKAQLARGEATLRQVRAARKQTSRSLEILVGRYPAAAIGGAADLVATPPPIPVGLPSDLLERRPDLIAAERAVAAEFLQVQTAQAARLPRFALTGALGTTSNALNNTISLGNEFWTVGANFAAPILTGGALAAQVEIETAEQEQALANFGLAALKAFGEVEQGLENETLLREQEDFLRSALAQAQEALRVAKAQFDVGRLDLLLVQQQQAQIIAANVNLLSIRNRRLQQRIDLHLALGGSFESEEES
jgi:outer membrane protein, multidrug efflux system